ncbi:GrdX family protein [Desulfosporosinus sp. SB140]|uniref:GrdX family protein n=1 Tax=Desulfosporosinus paludis TaxID=3115649 RepID=UPI00388D7CAC
MKNIIITNNPAVAEKKDNVLFVEGSVEETLIKVRDLVHEGYELISHPLAASLRVMFSPFRSVILSEKSETMDILSAEIIEDSIIKYKRHMDFRNSDTVNSADYKMIDLILLETALHEQSVAWRC